MSGDPTASLPTSVEKRRALVGELVQANAGLREVIAAKDHQIASLERRITELYRQFGYGFVDLEQPPSSDSPYRKPAWISHRGDGRVPRTTALSF